jgi:hypothetical protein
MNEKQINFIFQAIRYYNNKMKLMSCDEILQIELVILNSLKLLYKEETNV